jgi:hypothetical protein
VGVAWRAMPCLPHKPPMTLVLVRALVLARALMLVRVLVLVRALMPMQAPLLTQPL